MSSQLTLANIRRQLVRLEETIIFALIERAQFCRNPKVYEKGAFPEGCGHESLVGFLLHETEKIHAQMRRYTSPDEHPFFRDLPEPVLLPLRYEHNPLHPNTVNINDRIRDAYEQDIVPLICRDGDDQQYGSSAVCDVALLQSLSKRIHYGKFVAESKFRSHPETYNSLIRAADDTGLLQALTDQEVESQVLKRVERKATLYCAELRNAGGDHDHPVDPQAVVAVYANWIVPCTKLVQVQYLRQRLPDARRSVDPK